jgi:ribose 5-phosphate isomerase
MRPPLPSERVPLKWYTAARVVTEVEDEMVLGLGSGSTAAFAVEAPAVRIAKSLRVVGIPTSEKMATLARRLGVPLTSFAEYRRNDIAIDGADQVERGTLDLAKGLGGALLREKMVANASDRMIVVVDETKLVDRLGGNTPLSMEIVSFGWQTVLDRQTAIGCRAAAASRRRRAVHDGWRQLHRRLPNRRDARSSGVGSSAFDSGRWPREWSLCRHGHKDRGRWAIGVEGIER